jgi:hypothetical protein
MDPQPFFLFVLGDAPLNGVNTFRRIACSWETLAHGAEVALLGRPALMGPIANFLPSRKTSRHLIIFASSFFASSVQISNLFSNVQTVDT